MNARRVAVPLLALTGRASAAEDTVTTELRPAGIRADLQALRGSRWVTINSADARADGTYRVGYTFTRSARGRFSFRVRVRHFPRFPYFVGASPTIRVRVLR